MIQKEVGSFSEKIKEGLQQAGALSHFIILTKDCLYAIRDKNGLRPLSIAKLDEGYCLSSETLRLRLLTLNLSEMLNRVR